MFCERMKRDCYAEADLTFLFTISNIINKSHDINKDLELVLANLCEFLNAQFSMITIINRNFSTIEISAAYGLTDEEKHRGVYQIGEGIIGEVVRTKKAKIIPDISKDPNFLNKTGIATELGHNTAFLCIPVLSDEDITGTLSIHKHYSKNIDFSPELKFMNLVGLLIGRNVALRQKQIEELEELKAENRRLKETPVSKRPDNIVGNSSLMNDLYGLIEKVAPINTTVMIRGESGVGKELIAEAIHKASARKNGPFVKVNCSALPENLIESELFGHEKGSFTGADTQHVGRFELADGGTIFLDEIGDVPLSIQVKLLRVLQQRQFERVGGTKTIDVNVRVITATNRNLEEMIKQNLFREDFYYRISVFPIYVPALRERRADIPILVDHFIDKLNRINGTSVKRITSGALDLLMVYHWPGNIRELENVIERSMVLSIDDVIRSYNLPPTLQTASSSGTSSKGTLEMVLDKVEKQMILDTLISTRGNSAKAAHALGVSERIIGLRIQKYDIDVQNYKHLSDDDNS
jgi:Nif-specific regulatory protein